MIAEILAFSGKLYAVTDIARSTDTLVQGVWRAFNNGGMLTKSSDIYK
jgi:hypothetical protein